MSHFIDDNGNPDSVENNNFDGKRRLAQWLNKQMKIEMTDGRIIIGDFVCTDKDANIILSSSVETYNVESEYLARYYFRINTNDFF